MIQLVYLAREIKALNKRRWQRWLTCWFSRPVMILINYRVGRCLYLTLGDGFHILHALALPLLFVLRPWLGGADIHYQADIGAGLRVLHPGLGVVISAYTIAGENLTLTGGNCIGRRSGSTGAIIIGDNVTLGANAVIIGAVKVGCNVVIGAGAVVVGDVADGLTVVGVPAHALNRI